MPPDYPLGLRGTPAASCSWGFSATVAGLVEVWEAAKGDWRAFAMAHQAEEGAVTLAIYSEEARGRSTAPRRFESRNPNVSKGPLVRSC